MRKIPLVSFLCGGLTCHKKSPESPSYKNVKRDEINSDHNAVAAAQTTAVDEIPNDTLQPSSSSDQQPPPLPPPPGGLHMRAASYHHQPSSSRSKSISKLALSLSTRVLRNNGDGASSSSLPQENKISESTKKDKKLKHEDSIWKKTIILGEKCRVPDEDDGNILYDEKGNRISTYHSKSPSAVFSSTSSSSRHGSQG